MVKFARKVAGTAPFKDMIGQYLDYGLDGIASEPCTLVAKELNPGSEVQSDDRLAEWITNNCNTTWRAYLL